MTLQQRERTAGKRITIARYTRVLTIKRYLLRTMRHRHDEQIAPFKSLVSIKSLSLLVGVGQKPERFNHPAEETSGLCAPFD